MEVALELGEHAGLVPGAVVGIEREPDAPRPAALGGRDLDLRARGALAVRVGAAADQPGRAEDGQRQLAAAHHLVLHRVLEERRHSTGIDEAVGGERRQGDLTEPLLGLEGALDDGELAFRGREPSLPWERDVKPEAMIGERVLE